MTLRELILVRHGESEANVAAGEAERAGLDRLAAPARDADVELSSTGVDQARAVGGFLRALSAADQPDAVWVSSYRRARQTASLALDGAGLDPVVVVDERLRDRELGILDGYTSAGVERVFPDEAQRRRYLGKFFYRPPGGESWADVALRVRSVLADIDRSVAETAADARVLVVSHDAVTSLFRYVCEALDESTLLEEVRRHPVPNASVTRLHRDDDRHWRAVTLGDTAHLEQHDAEVTTHSGDPDGTRPN